MTKPANILFKYYIIDRLTDIGADEYKEYIRNDMDDKCII